MLNKIMMTGRITTDLSVVTEEDRSYCKFSIAVDQQKRNDTEPVETDIFTCLAFNDNAKSVSFLYEKNST
ncbi:single-stranded DNA-binding protein [uncultured Ruminococcus sp.]|uniref:single-stranded DNA-binding protein n=1 Tax=uncultured Ruminococcus sp. TaxID=165186 RepID=UPI0025EF878C|nr:single-stranded DNA-binding protein [uncultured Ruminococcus sp.]